MRFKQVAFLRLNQIYYGLDYDFLAQIFLKKNEKKYIRENQWNWAILTDYIQWFSGFHHFSQDL